MLAYAITRLAWRFARPRVYAADPLAPWRRAAEGMKELETL